MNAARPQRPRNAGPSCAAFGRRIDACVYLAKARLRQEILDHHCHRNRATAVAIDLHVARKVECHFVWLLAAFEGYLGSGIARPVGNPITDPAGRLVDPSGNAILYWVLS